MEIVNAEALGMPVVRPVGTLDEREAPHLRDALLSAAAEQPPAVVCDLRDLTTVPETSTILHVVADQLRHWPSCPLVVVASPTSHELLGALGVPRGAVVVADLAELPTALAEHPPPPPRQTLTLGPSPDTPARARAALRSTLQSWGLSDDDYVELVLAVDELVTNAVVHAGTDVDLVISLREAEVAAAVGDRSDEKLAPRAAGDWAESGRGLAMVERLTRHWGVLPRHPTGKAVWLVVDRGDAADPQD